MQTTRHRRPEQTIFFLALGLLLLFFGGCSSADQTVRRPGQIQHVVLCWLKEPGNAEARQRVVEASHTLKSIPGVVAVHAGAPLPSERPVVDDSFDVGVVIVVKDAGALQTYLEHPTHKKAVSEVLGPLSERILIYDILEE